MSYQYESIVPSLLLILKICGAKVDITSVLANYFQVSKFTRVHSSQEFTFQDQGTAP